MTADDTGAVFGRLASTIGPAGPVTVTGQVLDPALVLEELGARLGFVRNHRFTSPMSAAQLFGPWLHNPDNARTVRRHHLEAALQALAAAGGGPEDLHLLRTVFDLEPAADQMGDIS